LLNKFSAAWASDRYDFNAVNLVNTQLSARYNRPPTDVTFSITLPFLFRSLGAAFLGVMSDMFGRKWLLSINFWILAVLRVGTAFAPTYEAFISVQALFRVAMGGI
jgi:MFS transporter, SHS family, lactate transporter